MNAVAPKRTKALPVATEREGWQRKVDAATSAFVKARDACSAMEVQVGRLEHRLRKARRVLWVALPSAVVAGYVLRWLVG